MSTTRVPLSEVSDLMAPGQLEEVHRALEVHRLIDHRLLDRRPYAGPGRQVADRVGALGGIGEHGLELGLVRDDVGSEQPKPPRRRFGLNISEVQLFDGRVVEAVEVVDADDLIPPGKEAVGDARADETGGARQEDSHGEEHTDRGLS